MAEVDDGGPAFPRSHPFSHERTQDGMSLRKWFAGQALIGLGTHVEPGFSIYSAEGLRSRAELAYRQADAMIAAGKAEK